MTIDEVINTALRSQCRDNDIYPSDKALEVMHDLALHRIVYLVLSQITKEQLKEIDYTFSSENMEE